MEGYCSTGQSPQWAVVPMEEEEEEEKKKKKKYAVELTLSSSKCVYITQICALRSLQFINYKNCKIFGHYNYMCNCNILIVKF